MYRYRLPLFIGECGKKSTVLTCITQHQQRSSAGLGNTFQPQVGLFPHLDPALDGIVSTPRFVPMVTPYANAQVVYLGISFLRELAIIPLRSSMLHSSIRCCDPIGSTWRPLVHTDSTIKPGDR